MIPEEIEFLFGPAGRGWVEGALLIGLFWAALAHPERIRRPLEFRLSALLLGLSLAVPPILRLYPLAHHPPGSTRGGPGPPEWFVYSSAASPILLMAAVWLGVDSVLPRRVSAAGPSEPRP